MKKMMILAMMMVMTISANAMNYNAAKNEALYLSDKMAYELDLTAAQYEAVYEINLDYLLTINGRTGAFGIHWGRRNANLRDVLNAWQFRKYMSIGHFYRPVIGHRDSHPKAPHRPVAHVPNSHPKAPANHKAPAPHKAPGHHGARK